MALVLISVLLLVSSAFGEKVSLVEDTRSPLYHPEQLAVLDAIYQQTGGSSWFQDDNWENPIYCLRYGISCDVNRNVIQISLSSNNLTGTLPSFKDLSFLQSLDLSENFLTEGIVGLEFLGSLTTVNLENNVFQGPLPRFPSSITSLNLNDNFFAGDINSFLPNLSKITTLSITGTMIYGNLSTIPFPKTLSTCNFGNLPFTCPVPSMYKNCGATCSTCATNWNSCDYCLDTTCGWCQLDGTRIASGICLEISSVKTGVYQCGISGLLQTSCKPTCSGSMCTNSGSICIPNVGVVIKTPQQNCTNHECVYESEIMCKGSNCNNYCPGFSQYCCPASNPVCTDGGQCCCTSGHAGGCANHDGDCIYN